MRIVCLPGDGIGTEVMLSAKAVLAVLLPDAALEEHLIGGAAIHATGTPLPPETVEACRGADAVVLGAVGLPEFDGKAVRPEQGLLGLRRELEVYANLRPARADGVDLLIVRELIGGLYFGERGIRADGTVYDTCEYHPSQVERIVRRGYELAQARGKRLASVDKANVLDTSRLWRRIVTELAAEYPDVQVEHVLVDTAAMQLATDPGRYDVLVTENMFGDILSDIAAAVTGGLGVAASASLGDGRPGIFEPVHGSAPDIAGRGVANPSAMLDSLVLMLAHGLAEPALARALEVAVESARATAPTADLGGTAGTQQFTDAVLAALQPRG